MYYFYTFIISVLLGRRSSSFRDNGNQGDNEESFPMGGDNLGGTSQRDRTNRAYAPSSQNSKNRIAEYNDYNNDNYNNNSSMKNNSNSKNKFDNNEFENQNSNTNSNGYQKNTPPKKPQLSRGFGSEYPDNYVPPKYTEPPPKKSPAPTPASGQYLTPTPDKGKIPPRKSSLRGPQDEDQVPSSSSRTASRTDNSGSRRSSNTDYTDGSYTQNGGTSDSYGNDYDTQNNGYSNKKGNKQPNDRNGNGQASSNPYTDSEADPYGADETDLGQLRECPNCSRKFNPKPYEKHVQICAKLNAKRKVFDSTKMRIEGNPELIQILNKNMKEENKKKALELKKSAKMGAGGGGRRDQDAYPNEREGMGGTGRGGGGGGVTPIQAELDAAAAAAKKSKWQLESNAFRASMRAAREVTKAIATGAPLPPPVASAPDPSLVQCPHCSRRYVNTLSLSCPVLAFPLSSLSLH
jgi:zinc-finger of a C2HC-type